MLLDLSRLERYGKTAVHCVSEEQASMFMEAMWEQYPDRVKPMWRKGQTNWNAERERKKCIYYLPRIVRTPEETQHCQSSRLNFSTAAEYKIIEFSDLVVSYDIGEFSTELDIKSLFGMG